MANCRTCAALGGYCAVTGRVFLGTIPAFIHIASRFTPPPGTIPEECSYWSKRETPLLVDVLAEAVCELLPCVSGSGRAKSAALGRTALARYKEEVGDGS